MWFRVAFAIMLCVLGISTVFAADKPATAEQKQKVMTILAGVKVEDPATLDTTEDALVAEGAGIVPALREVLQAEQKKLTEIKPEAPGDAYLIQQRISVLDAAIIRLTWQLNPREMIDQRLAKLKDFNGQPFTWRVRPVRITDAEVAHIFPGYLFYIVRYPSYPVARALPEPLKYSNLFIIQRNSRTTQLVTDTATLEQFFRSVFKSTPDFRYPLGTGTKGISAGIHDAIYSWLRLAEELYQDGMYRFSIPAADLKVTTTPTGWTASGRAVVDPSGGNTGEITATMMFNKAHELESVTTNSTLKPGMRPICQATKLLDTDDIVRRMAEQDILLMGRAAECYLVEQRAKAGPELQAAIDRIWARIMAEGR